MSDEKLAVTLWNYKGGVGKSTLALILSQIAAKEGLKVLAVDLDPQRNLSETLKLSASLFPSIEVRTTLSDKFTEENYSLYVIDAHPTMDKSVLEAVKFSDIVLVPVLGDFHSIVNLSVVFDYLHKAGIGVQQAAIVKNCMSNLKVNAEVEGVLDELNYPVAGRLPRCNTLLRNIASGDKWDKYLRENQRAQFIDLYNNIWNAYKQMHKGNFSNLWNN
jgi:cellulose biosynthesis protein BcsQ